MVNPQTVTSDNETNLVDEQGEMSDAMQKVEKTQTQRRVKPQTYPVEL